MEQLLALDGNILLWIQNHLRREWLSPIVIAYTKLGAIGFIWILLSICLLCVRKTRWAGAAGLLGQVIMLAVNNIFIKNLVARTRPYEVVDGLILLTKKATDYSFPSGHTASAFAATVAICMMTGKNKIKWILPIMAFLMGFSRLYIGIHYPSDVLGGAVIGSICGYIAVQVFKDKNNFNQG